MWHQGVTSTVRFLFQPLTYYLNSYQQQIHSSMADYMEYGQSSSFRQGDILADANEMRRSMERGSHNSHGHASASTWSWIVSNQMNPPPLPPVERSSSPFHDPRPLPDPSSVRRMPVRNPALAIENDEGDDLPIGRNSLGMQDDQQPEVLSEGGDNHFLPTSMGHARSKHGGRSVIGGFMSAQLRFPSVFRIGGEKSNTGLARQGSFGTEGTSSPATGMTAGNTLPRDLPNPSIGPSSSNPRFAQYPPNSHASTSANTRSWVVSNQTNPPPPPVEPSFSIRLTSLHNLQPIPFLQPVRRTPFQNPRLAIEDNEEENDLPIGRSTSMAHARSNRGGRSVIGGFMSGQWRFPSLRIGGQKSKRRLARQGSFGTDSSSPAIGMTTGVSPPRYNYSPSIGPSDPQFPHRMSIAVANGALPLHPYFDPLQQNENVSPPPLLNHSFERLPEPSCPNFPTITQVTPPSANEGQITDLYEFPPDYHSNDSNPGQPVHAPRVLYAYQPSHRIRDEPGSAMSISVGNSPTPITSRRSERSSNNNRYQRQPETDPPQRSLTPITSRRSERSSNNRYQRQPETDPPQRSLTPITSRQSERSSNNNRYQRQPETDPPQRSLTPPITSRPSERWSNNNPYQTSQYPIPPYPYTHPYGPYPPAPMPVPPQILTVMIGFFSLISLFLFLFIFTFTFIFVLIIVREG